MLTRNFSYVDRNDERHSVVAIIHTPKKQERNKYAVPEQPDSYSCAFQVTGADLNINGMGFGIDELSAVFATLRDLRLELDKLGDRISFLETPGYTGIPRMVTLGHPIEVQRRVEAVLDNEHQKIQDELKARREAKRAGPVS